MSAMFSPFSRDLSERSWGFFLTLSYGAARCGRGGRRCSGGGRSLGGGRGGGSGSGLGGGRGLGRGAAAAAGVGVGATAAGEELGAGDDVVGDGGVVDADLDSGVGALLT